MAGLTEKMAEEAEEHFLTIEKYLRLYDFEKDKTRVRIIMSNMSMPTTFEAILREYKKQEGFELDAHDLVDNIDALRIMGDVIEIRERDGIEELYLLPYMGPNLVLEELEERLFGDAPDKIIPEEYPPEGKKPEIKQVDIRALLSSYRHAPLPEEGEMLKEPKVGEKKKGKKSDEKKKGKKSYEKKKGGKSDEKKKGEKGDEVKKGEKSEEKEKEEIKEKNQDDDSTPQEAAGGVKENETDVSSPKEEI